MKRNSSTATTKTANPSSSMPPPTLPKWMSYNPYIPNDNIKEREEAKSIISSSYPPPKRKRKRLAIDNDELHFATMIEEEECHLRRKAYFYISENMIENNFDAILQTHVRNSIYSPLVAFMERFRPKDYVDCNINSDNDVDVDVDVDDTDDSPLVMKQIQQFLQRNREQRSFQSTILPIGIIHVPPSTLDCNLIIQTLKQEFITHHQQHSSSSSSFYKPAVCIVPHGQIGTVSSSSHNKHDKDSRSNHQWYQKHFKNNHCIEYYIYTILSQCIQQESDPMQYLDLLQPFSSSTNANTTTSTISTTKTAPSTTNSNNTSTYKNNGFTFFNSLLEWSSKTSNFNSILLFLQRPKPNHYNSNDNQDEEYEHGVQVFLSTIASLRHEYGIPIGIVFYSTTSSSSRDDNDVHIKETIWNSLGGGIFVDEFDFGGLNQDIIDEFITSLLYPKNNKPTTGTTSTTHSETLLQEKQQLLPILPSKTIMNALRHEFEFNHKSIVQYKNQFKMALAHHFTLSGSFLSLKENENFNKKYGLHCNWFYVNLYSRQRMLRQFQKQQHYDNSEKDCMDLEKACQSSQDLDKMMQVVFAKKEQVPFICQLLAVIEMLLSQCHKKSLSSTTTTIKTNEEDYELQESNLMEVYLAQAPKFKSILDQLFLYIRSAPKGDIIQFVHKLNLFTMKCISKTINQVLVDNNVSSSSCCSQDVVDEMSNVSFFFDKCIVFMDRVESKQLEWDLREWMIEKVHGILLNKNDDDNDDDEGGIGKRSNPLMSIVLLHNDSMSESFASSLHTKPRSDLASAITNPLIQEIDYDNNAFGEYALDMKTALSVFDSRLIQVDEWFRQFFEERFSDMESESNYNLVHRFGFCVYQLMICGIVIKSRRSDSVFEKAVLVWASG